MKQAVLSSDAPIPPSISVEAASPTLTLSAEQQEQEVDNTLNANLLHCNGIEWKVVEGVVEDWRCMPKFGAHILWGNDVDEARRTPLDYWMMSFPSQMLADISIWTSNCLPQGSANAKEDEVLAVFGALYSLTRTSEGRRDLWSTTEDGLFPAPRFGERYSLTRDRFEILLRCLSFCPAHEAIGDKWAPVRRLIGGFNQRRVEKLYPGWQLCVDESVSSWSRWDATCDTDRQKA